MYIEDTVLKYNDLDDDEFHKKCLGENESFEGLLKRIGKLKKQAKQEYNEFMLWLDAMRSRLGLKYAEDFVLQKFMRRTEKGVQQGACAALVYVLFSILRFPV